LHLLTRCAAQFFGLRERETELADELARLVRCSAAKRRARRR
jgi:hypothetical protein